MVLSKVVVADTRLGNGVGG